MIESLQRRDRRGSGLVVAHALAARTVVAQGDVDEPDVAHVLVARHAVPNFGRVLQIRLGLADQFGHLGQSVDDVPVPFRGRRVLQHIGRI